MFDKHTFMRILTKELTGKLLAHYEMAMEEVKKVSALSEAARVCKKHDVPWGVCWLAKYVFETDIS